MSDNAQVNTSTNNDQHDQHDSAFGSDHDDNHDNDNDIDIDNVTIKPQDIGQLTSNTIQSPFPDDIGATWHTITDDHKVWKRIVTESPIPNAQLCPPLWRITISIVGKLEDGTTFIDSGSDERDLILGQASQAKGVEIGLSTMRVGEHARLYMSSDYGWHNQNNKPELLRNNELNNVDMYYDIKVIRVEHEKNIFKMTLNEKLDYIEQRRILGKTLYEQHKYDSALRQYDRGLQVINQGLDKNSKFNKNNNDQQIFTEQQQQTVDNTEIMFYVNQSQCYYKLQRFTDCLEVLNKVLKIQPNHVKALYRRSQVHKHRDDIELMLVDLHKIKLLTNDNILLTSVNRDIQIAERQLTIENQRQKQQFAGMFDKPLLKKQGLGLYNDNDNSTINNSNNTLIDKIESIWYNTVTMFRSLCRRNTKDKDA